MVKRQDIDKVSPGVTQDAPQQTPEVAKKEKQNPIEVHKDAIDKTKKDLKSAQQNLQNKKERVASQKEAQDDLRHREGGEWPIKKGIPLASTEAFIRDRELSQSDKDRKEAEAHLGKVLGDKKEAERKSIEETGSLEALDPDSKKAIHTEVIRKSVTIGNITDSTKNFALEELKKTYPNFDDLETEEQNHLILRSRVVQKESQQIQSLVEAVRDKKTGVIDKVKLKIELNKAKIGLQKFDDTQINALTLDVFSKEKQGTMLGDETVIGIADRVLSERTLAEFVDGIGATNFNIPGLPDSIKKSLYNKNFEVPESVKPYYDSVIHGFRNGEIPVDRSQFPEGAEGDKQYQNEYKKFLHDYTGDEQANMSNIGEKMKTQDKGGLSPFIKFLADIFCHIGAALEKMGILKGTLWTDYIAGKSGSVESHDQANSINGVSGARFEIDKTLTGEEMVKAASKYLGWPYEYGANGSSRESGIDCSQLVVNSLIDSGCLPKGFDTTATGFASQSEQVGDGDGKIGDFLIRTQGGPHIAIIAGPRNADGSYPTIEATSRNKNGSGVIKTDRKPGDSGFHVHKNPFITGNQAAQNHNYEGFQANGEFANTNGKITTYQQYGDSSPDKYSSQGIGSFGRLRYGDLAVSRDVEAQFTRMGIKPGQTISLKLADGSTINTRWMDRTAKTYKGRTLTGRFDIFQKSGAHPKQDVGVVGIATGSYKKESASAAPSGSNDMQVGDATGVGYFKQHNNETYELGVRDCMTTTHKALGLTSDRLEADKFRKSNIIRDGKKSDLWNVSMSAAQYAGIRLEGYKADIERGPNGYYGGERALIRNNLEYYIEENVAKRVNDKPDGKINVTGDGRLMHYSKKIGIPRIVDDIKDKLGNGEVAMMGATGEGTNLHGHEWMITREGNELKVYEATNYENRGVSGEGIELGQYLSHNRRAQYGSEAIIFAKNTQSSSVLASKEKIGGKGPGIFVGDSLTVGSQVDPTNDASAMEDPNYGQYFEVGAPSKKILEFVGNAIKKKPPYISILAGTNDVDSGGNPMENIRRMVALCRQNNIPVFLGTLPPIPSKQEKVDMYNEQIRSLASDGVHIIDYAGLGKIVSRGLHPGPSGYAQMRQLAYQTIQKGMQA